jgi:serine/threonine protein kinase
MSGRTIRHYGVRRKLGGRGMGVVYEAENLRLARDERALERLQGEARTASALNLPNICTIHDIGDEGGWPFIVMKLLESQTLRHRIAKKPSKTEDFFDLKIQIADTLHAAPGKAIIQGAIKPGEYFRDASKPGEDSRFLAGETRRRPAQLTGATTITEDMLTSPVRRWGPVANMSPEQARSETLHGRTDLFSFGVVLYEMTTATLPLKGKMAAMIFAAIHTPAARQLAFAGGSTADCSQGKGAASFPLVLALPDLFITVVMRIRSTNL